MVGLMANSVKRTKNILSSRRIEFYEQSADVLDFWRKNPCIAAEDLLGVRLLDAQKYILNQSWNTQYNLWVASRNFGKTFLADVFMALKWMLFENQQIYIIGSTGSQSIQAFKKLEDMAMQRVQSCKTLTDIFANETKKSSACKTGFV
jgi:frataxin-like iron-binding protein CyaY